MTKKSLIDALSKFNDDDHIIIGDDASSYVPSIRKICGGRLSYMVYYCILEPGHMGPCYCGCKSLDFIPDKKD